MNTIEYSLVKVIEECAEVQQACSKMLRFGVEGVGPLSLGSNTDNLRSELGDLVVAIRKLELVLAVDLESTDAELNKKLYRYAEFRCLSNSIGTLT